MKVSVISGGNRINPLTCHKSLKNVRVNIRVVVLNATFNNILAISWQISFIGGRNRRKPPICRMSQTNFSVRGKNMGFKATFHDISVISWWFNFMGGGSGENNRPASSHWQTLSHAVVSSTPIYKTIYDGGRLTTIFDRYGTDSAYLYEIRICVLCFNGPIKKW